MVYVLLADGFEEVEAITPVDALRRARVDVALVGVTGMVVTGSHGVMVSADISVADMDIGGCEAIVVPGGLRGVENIKASADALQAIRDVASADGYVAAICAGPTILAKLGITDGKRAVCYPGMEDEMGKARMRRGASAVTDGKIITSRSAGTAWDLAFALLCALRGPETARSVSDAVHYDHLQI